MAGRPAPALMALLALVLAVVATGCGRISTSLPPPTPADFLGIATQLTKHGVSVDRWVSGDAGCTDPDLVPTAIAATASGLDQSSPVRLYVYIFRNRASFEKLRESIDGCAASFVTDPETFESIEASPFVVAGQGPWAPKFKDALRDALTVAAGTGD